MLATTATHADRSKVLTALKESPTALDSYKVSKAVGSSAMQAARTLFALKDEGLVSTKDPLDTANDLAAQFSLVARA